MISRVIVGIDGHDDGRDALALARQLVPNGGGAVRRHRRRDGAKLRENSRAARYVTRERSIKRSTCS